MGSTGTGNFTDYSGSPSQRGGKTGGSNNEDKCEKAFFTMLEEVDRCDFYKSKNNLPSVGDKLSISFDRRPLAKSKDGFIVGYLPTKYNHIKICIDDGYKYEATVIRSSSSIIASVSVDVSPV